MFKARFQSEYHDEDSVVLLAKFPTELARRESRARIVARGIEVPEFMGKWVAKLNVEEFLDQIEKIDGVFRDDEGKVSLDSLAALEVMALLHRNAADRMAEIDTSVDIYDFEAFLHELHRLGVFR